MSTRCKHDVVDPDCFVCHPTPKLDHNVNREDAAFYQGIAVSAAWMCRTAGVPTDVKYMLQDLGVSLEDLRKAKVEPYDLEVLAPLYEGKKL